MIRKVRLILLMMLVVGIVFGCAADDDLPPNNAFLFVYDMQLGVDQSRRIDVVTNIELDDTLTYDIDNPEAILIHDGHVFGLRGGDQSTVTIRHGEISHQFHVSVTGDTLPLSHFEHAWFDDISVTPVTALQGESRPDFIMGADISSIDEVLRRGGKFYGRDGVQTSAFKLMTDAGINYVRIRIWNDPVSPEGVPYGGGNNDIETAIRIGSMAKAHGMKILLVFHYSDFWADPGKQIIPKDWAAMTTADEIATALHDFTYQTMRRMAEGGAIVDMVQIGNEITPGLLTQGVHDYGNIAEPSRFNLPAPISGSVSNPNFITYLNAGLDAARLANPEVLTMIHIDRGANNSASRTFFNRLQNNGVDYDIIGLSYYNFYHGSMSNFQSNMNDLATRYGKPIVVSETSYGFTSQPYANTAHILTSPSGGYSLTPQGQANKLRDVINITANTPEQLGIGVFYWEPAWLPVAGAGWAGGGTPATWANQALFSYQGAALPSLDVFWRVREPS